MYLILITWILIVVLYAFSFVQLDKKKYIAIFWTTAMGLFILNLWYSSISIMEVGFFSETSILDLFTWINIGIIRINFSLIYDTLTMIMVVLITLISFLVHIYSFSYMSNDINLKRFIVYLCLFTLCMLVLVTSNNFLQLLVGWEGVGLSSYLLICFWYTRTAANLAAIKAMVVNRVGDISLLFVIIFIYMFFGSLNFGVVFNNIVYLLDYTFDLFYFEIRYIDLISLFLFIGAMGKSAQLILHIWLPEAMEGPTPVSALIHAATMVTAGVFLVVRCSIIFEQCSIILFFMVFIGSLTCFLMSFIGIFQQDIKKIVAYSTCSQLGYLFIGCGLSSYNVSFFHLFNHAFFKALLFLSMGVIIHALADEQDLRKMGSLVNMLPLVSLMVFFGNFALLGLPFLAGFYSKDLLIEIAYSRIFFDGAFSYILGLSAAGLTAFYSTRLFIRVFLGFSNSKKIFIYSIHEADVLMYFPLITLLLFSFFVGFYFFDLFCGLGSFFFYNSIYIDLVRFSGFFVEFQNTLNFKLYFLKLFEIIFFIKIMPLIVTLLGFIFYIYFDNVIYKFYEISYYRLFHIIMFNGLFFDKLYVDFILGKFFFFSYYAYYKNIEALFFQKYNIYIFQNITKLFFFYLKSILRGDIYSYILLVLLFLTSWYTFFVSFDILNIYYSHFYLILIFICFSFNFKNVKNKIDNNLKTEKLSEKKRRRYSGSWPINN